MRGGLSFGSLIPFFTTRHTHNRANRLSSTSLPLRSSFGKLNGNTPLSTYITEYPSSGWDDDRRVSSALTVTTLNLYILGSARPFNPSSQTLSFLSNSCQTLNIQIIRITRKRTHIITAVSRSHFSPPTCMQPGVITVAFTTTTEDGVDNNVVINSHK